VREGVKRGTLTAFIRTCVCLGGEARQTAQLRRETPARIPSVGCGRITNKHEPLVGFGVERQMRSLTDRHVASRERLPAAAAAGAGDGVGREQQAPAVRVLRPAGRGRARASDGAGPLAVRVVHMGDVVPHLRPDGAQRPRAAVLVRPTVYPRDPPRTRMRPLCTMMVTRLRADICDAAGRRALDEYYPLTGRLLAAKKQIHLASTRIA